MDGVTVDRRADAEVIPVRGVDDVFILEQWVTPLEVRDRLLLAFTARESTHQGIGGEHPDVVHDGRGVDHGEQ